MLLRHVLDIVVPEDQERSARWIRSQQRVDGSWGDFPGAPGTLSTTVEAWVALRLAINGLLKDGKLAADPLRQKVAAVSCGIYRGTPVLDLDYDEDSAADADANFVLLENGHIAEAQATAEKATYDEEGLLRLLRLARIGCNQIFAAQAKAVAA